MAGKPATKAKSRESSALTQRERVCQKVSRMKSARRRIRHCVRVIRLGAFTALALTAGYLWIDASQPGEDNRPRHWQERPFATLHRTGAQAGFQLQQIFVDGRQHVPFTSIQEAVGLKRGEPLFTIDLAAVKARLETIGWVKNAYVERSLPDTLHIHIEERTPVALWQNQGRVYLIDTDGTPIATVKASDYPQLMLVVGEGANERFAALAHILSQDTDLLKQVTAAVWVGNRRWDVTLANGLSVKLPEIAPERAWLQLADMQRRHNLLARAITAVDMRIDGKVFIRYSSGEQDKLKPGESQV
jgi:cell division protein FtsQ